MEPKVSLVTTDALVVASDISILPILKLAPQLEPFKAAAENLEAQAERAVIDSEDAWQRGSDFETICQQRWDQLEALRKAAKGPVDDYGKLIQSLFVPILARYKAAREKVNAKRLTFYKTEGAKRQAAAEAVRRANEEAALKLAEEAQKSGDAAGAAAILEVATMTPKSVPALRLGGTNTFGKSSNVTKRWTATVENPMEVLKAILAGNVPISIVDWKQVELNKVAASLKVEKSVFGLKIQQAENLQQR
jgi:hypothetical protein